MIQIFTIRCRVSSWMRFFRYDKPRSRERPMSDRRGEYGPRSHDWRERSRWFWRRDKSGAEQFSPEACTLQIPIDSTNLRLYRLHMRLADKRWVVRRWFSPEELGYRKE